MEFIGTLYRALNPLWAREPLSGAGAAQFGGRFNARGTPALYTSLRPETAMREANQAGAFQPITLVAYAAEIEKVFNATDTGALASIGFDAAMLADPCWRDTMLTDKISGTQRLARSLIEQGFSGMLAPSYAPQATTEDRNLVLWSWGTSLPAKLRLIDDQGRLGYLPS